MKKLLLTAVALATFIVSASAQDLQVLPNDPAVKVGKLENGMTYYIRHNDKPEKRAEFYLATNVGAIQETPDQDGLAHFLEHMCFNGTKNFPGKTLLNWLESIGAQFGANINASTGVEQTQYMLNNIPLVRESVVDTCLLIMHDYSHFVSCDPEEIDAERGVILEERRTRRNASWRIREKSYPYYFGDSKYATTSIIGSQENLQTFKPQSLLDFYHTWYRPDLQALIVVGDVDVDQVEAKIKTIFADIPAVENPTPKAVITVPGNVEPMVGIITDPEAPSTSIELIWKHEARPLMLNNTVQGLMIDLIQSVVGGVMQERFSDIVSRPGAPFIDAYLSIGSACTTLDMAMGQVSVKEGEVLSGLKAYMTEIEKMKRFGFTEAEIDRAKVEIVSSYESNAKRADSRKNSELVPDLINNFFLNYSYMEPQQEYQLVQALLGQIPAELINEFAKSLITEENFVMLYKAPEKEGLVHPTESQLLEVVESVENMEIQAPESEEIAAELLDSSALKGSKVKKSKNILYGATQWELKNGVKVILLPTEYEKDRIMFQIVKDGGFSLVEDEDLVSFESNLYSMYSNLNGVSSFNGTTLSKMLAGKKVSVSPSIGSLSSSISGSSTVKDFETALQLMYLYYTDPRFDEDAFANAVSSLNALLPNVMNQPEYQLQKQLYKTLYNDNPRNVFVDETTVSRASLATIERVTRSLYSDAAGATMYIVGNFDIDAVKPLVEKYVGSLPKGKKATHWVDRNVDLSKDNKVNDFKVDMQTPKSTVLQVLRSDIPYTRAASVAASALNYILDMIYVETLREEEGGTYGASVSVSLSRRPKEVGVLEVYFDTNPSSADKLREIALEGIRKIAENGPSEEQFNKTIKNLEKNIPERKITNSYWMSALTNWVDFGEDMVEEYEAAVKALTPADIQALASSFVNESNKIEIVMRPGKTAEKE
ncbi:MAG: insulinase family protein [Rikenellaceae bacterium]|nr:insulinase family protein [Rikenellaceae bacterium]